MSEVGQKRERSMLEEIRQELAQEEAKKQTTLPEFPSLEVDIEEIVIFIKGMIKLAMTKHKKRQISCYFNFWTGQIMGVIDPWLPNTAIVSRPLFFVAEWKKSHPQLYAADSQRYTVLTADRLRKMESDTWDVLRKDPRFKDLNIRWDIQVMRYVIEWE